MCRVSGESKFRRIDALFFGVEISLICFNGDLKAVVVVALVDVAAVGMDDAVAVVAINRDGDGVVAAPAATCCCDDSLEYC